MSAVILAICRLVDASFDQLTADQTIGNYWIRANASEGPTGFVGGINSVRVFLSLWHLHSV